MNFFGGSSRLNGSLFLWLLLAVLCAVAAVGFADGIAKLFDLWKKEEYSHGYLLVFVTAFFIWMRREELVSSATRGLGNWFGLALAASGMLALLAGQMSTLHIIEHYGILLVVFGVSFALVGFGGMRVIWAPLLLLAFAIPLPNFLYQNLSSQLQLISSQLGVFVIRFFDIPVYLQGNVIDLGIYKLQVVEACSGLRYLFPLMSFGYICAYLYRGPVWHRAIALLSTIPITVLMNSFRIGVIGVLVDRWGIEMAEGFLHDFEGWIVFMACTAVLIGELWLLNRFARRNPPPFQSVFGLDLASGGKKVKERDAGQRSTLSATPALLASAVVVILGAVSAAALGEREEVIPDRTTFNRFPLSLGGWQGQENTLEQRYINALKFSDYYLADYLSPTGDWVNFYVAYYDSQRSGASAHSPRSCMPGDGWRMLDLQTRDMPGIAVAGQPLSLNRVKIQKGDHRQLVYYWFQQRGRVLTNEYLVKWFLFWDALTRNRTDGALVRFTTPLAPEETWDDADARLQSMVRQVATNIPDYVPGYP